PSTPTANTATRSLSSNNGTPNTAYVLRNPPGASRHGVTSPGHARRNRPTTSAAPASLSLALSAIPNVQTNQPHLSIPSPPVEPPVPGGAGRRGNTSPPDVSRSPAFGPRTGRWPCGGRYPTARPSSG